MAQDHLVQETPRETVERCAEHGAEWLGDKVEFRPVAVDAPRERAKAIFHRHGFSEFVVEDPRPESVLSGCSRAGKTPEGYITRRFVSPNPDTPIAIHVTRVSGNDESGDEYSCLARVRIGYRTDPVSGFDVPFAVARPPEGQTQFTDNAARDRAMWIATECNYRLGHVKNADISDACRKALESLGAVQSLGRGNNYWLSANVAERAHSFLEDVSRELGLYYLRAPITTLGGKTHLAAAMAQAAQASLEDDLADMETRLEHAITAATNPKLTPKGVPVKRTATLQFQVDLLQGIGAKLDLYRHVIENRLTSRLDGLKNRLETHFTTLLDGGEVFGWEPELKKTPEAPVESDTQPITALLCKEETFAPLGVPNTERSPASEPAAKTGSDAPFGW